MARLLALLLSLLAIQAAVAKTERWRDDDGKWWAVSAETALPQRWIVLGPHLVDMVSTLGGQDRIVGVQDDHPTWGRRTRSLSGHVIVGQPGQVSEERLRRVRPDLIVYWPEGMQTQQVARLRQLGVPLLAVSPRQLDEIPERLYWLGVLLRQPASARALADRYGIQLQQWRQLYGPGRRLKGLHQVWLQPLYSLAPDHLVSQALALCGVDSIVPATGVAAPVVSLEHVLRSAPDVILVPRQIHAQAMDFWQRYQTLPAVRRGAILALDDRELTRPGPGLLDAIPTLCQQLQPWR